MTRHYPGFPPTSSDTVSVVSPHRDQVLAFSIAQKSQPTPLLCDLPGLLRHNVTWKCFRPRFLRWGQPCWLNAKLGSTPPLLFLNSISSGYSWHTVRLLPHFSDLCFLLISRQCPPLTGSNSCLILIIIILLIIIIIINCSASSFFTLLTRKCTLYF